MAKTDRVKYWLSLASSDLRAARAVFKGGYWRHALLFCHFAVEKGLKAAIQKKTGKEPPKTDHLSPLLRRASCDLPPDVKEFVGTLSGFGIEALCQTDTPVPTRRFTRVLAHHGLSMASRVHRILKQVAS